MDTMPAPVSSGQGKNRIMIILVFILILIIGAAAVFAQWYMTYTSPQEVFYRALNQQMQTKYLTREYDEESRDPQNVTKMTVSADTDLSQLASPKSHMKYSYATTKAGQVVQAKDGESIIADNTQADYVTKVVPTSVGSTLNKWSHRALSSTGADYTYDLAYIDSIAMFNSIQGVTLAGAFNDQQRTELMDMIKTTSVYTIEGTRTVGGDIVYTVNLDRKKLNALNEKAAELAGAPRKYVISTKEPSDSVLEFWVESGSGRLAKVTYAVGKDSDAASFKKTVTFSYPSSLAIALPTNIKDEN